MGQPGIPERVDGEDSDQHALGQPLDDFEASAPDAQQLKFYAPDVGLVRFGFAADDDEREQLGLVSQDPLDDKDLAVQRGTALLYEMRAFVYGTTEPATKARPPIGESGATGTGALFTRFSPIAPQM